jgi:hypothetical protein
MGYLQVLERQWVILEPHAVVVSSVVSSVVTGLAETSLGFPPVEAACHDVAMAVADQTCTTQGGKPIWCPCKLAASLQSLNGRMKSGDGWGVMRVEALTGMR